MLLFNYMSCLSSLLVDVVVLCSCRQVFVSCESDGSCYPTFSTKIYIQSKNALEWMDSYFLAVQIDFWKCSIKL